VQQTLITFTATTTVKFSSRCKIFKIVARLLYLKNDYCNVDVVVYVIRLSENTSLLKTNQQNPKQNKHSAMTYVRKVTHITKLQQECYSLLS